MKFEFRWWNLCWVWAFFFSLSFCLVQTEVGKMRAVLLFPLLRDFTRRPIWNRVSPFQLIFKVWIGNILSSAGNTYLFTHHYEQNWFVVVCGTDRNLKLQWNDKWNIEQTRKLGPVLLYHFICWAVAQVSLTCRVFVSVIIKGGC